ncbi:hypothetical protein HIM_06353 [Hirsutella minnesotensis 3608]|uniref:Glucose-methanol-choline oxidoreductase N-terminal domain-containing protein n=1 Tax=Hirsutella minnesotensis 3608 TaxID=1043627 RepID=A0A0F7ZZJ8_9HYPO|nr:hypothetical protein HIM_06353 [Hirsutella minnesotensis 3608]
MSKKMYPFLVSLLLLFAHQSIAFTLESPVESILRRITPPAAQSILSKFTPGKGYVPAKLGSLRAKPTPDQEFDYIVCGGGTAGNAIGVRLAEAGYQVAIVEAGYVVEVSKPILTTVPLFDVIGIGWSPLDVIPTVDWNFQTVPQTGGNNRRFHFTRGKCLGGTSALHFMVYHRGTTGTYDWWADAVGDDKYRLNNFQKFFKKSVDFTPSKDGERKTNSSAPFNPDDFLPVGSGGPVQVSYTNWVSTWATWVEQGLKAVGLKHQTRFNQGELMGYHYAQTTTSHSEARRSFSAEYVYSAKKRGLKTLKVFLNTHALKILFDQDNNANGVLVQHFTSQFKIKARKEVIVSAGAFQSPQLLMVSGIGPADTLNQFNIPIISTLPGVGQNMWDHIFYGPSRPVNFPTLNDLILNPIGLIKSISDYFLKAKGPLTSNVVDLLGWEKLPEQYRRNFTPETQEQLAGFPNDWPEVEFISGNGYLKDFQWPVAQQLEVLDGKNYATLLGAMVAPLSRGNVTIRSASSLVQPVINPNWLTAKADQEVAIAWFRRMREVWNTQALQSISQGEEKYPGREIETDEDILAYVQKSFMTVWHPACTCKMGKREDKMAVVDHEARVFGVQGLRVVDASAFPLLPPGHPQSTVYALAEKIADDIISGGRKEH